jgi:hypothetical protein
MLFWISDKISFRALWLRFRLRSRGCNIHFDIIPIWQPGSFPSVPLRLCLRLLMLPSQLIPLDQKAAQQAHGGKADIHDPQVMQTPCKRFPSYLPLPRRQAIHDMYRGNNVETSQVLRGLRAQSRDEFAGLLRHFVLQNNAADDDGNAGRQVSDEMERRNRCTSIALVDIALECGKRKLEIWTESNTGNDLIENDLSPAAIPPEVGEEAVAYSREC